jgi:hypothetical protein
MSRKVMNLKADVGAAYVSALSRVVTPRRHPGIRRQDSNLTNPCRGSHGSEFEEIIVGLFVVPISAHHAMVSPLPNSIH